SLNGACWVFIQKKNVLTVDSGLNWVFSYFSLTLAMRAGGTRFIIRSYFPCSMSLTSASSFAITETSIESTWPPGSSGIALALSFAQYGLRSYCQPRPGWDLVITYGPVAGGGLADRSSIGVPAGTGATKIRPSSLENVPRGLTRLITILPVLSSVWIPGIP